MKAYFKAEDEMESKRLAKSLDMAMFLWQLEHNFNYDRKYKIKDILKIMRNEYGINTNELID